MTTRTSLHTETPSRTGSERANALAIRLEEGARALIAFAMGLTDDEWKMRVPHDGRTVGVIVHHVASVYPVEIQVAQTVASGKPLVGVTMDDIHAMNATHAAEHKAVTKDEAIDLLRTNSVAAAAAIRALSDEELAQAAPASLYNEAPVTSQFVLEDHAVRHSYHHLAILRRTVRS
jgi:Mycothiol maleylpyruvate isomerase N-terminal domain